MITITFKSPFMALAAFSRALWCKSLGYRLLAEPEVSENREKTCWGCPRYCHLNDQCMECGCLISAKVALNTEKCPLDKWGRVWIKKSLPEAS